MASPNLLGLPRELRNIIYRFATKRVNLSPIGNEQRDSAVVVDHGPIPELLAVNKQIRDEYMDAISFEMVLIFQPHAIPELHFNLQELVRKDVPPAFLNSITRCELNLTMGGYLDEFQQANQGLSTIRDRSQFVRQLGPLLWTMLKTLKTVVSPSANIHIRCEALEYHEFAPGGRLEPDLWFFHTYLLLVFEINLSQLLHHPNRKWPQPGKLQYDFFLVTPLSSTLVREEDSDAMAATPADDVGSDHGAQVLWKVFPIEGIKETEDNHLGFAHEMVVILDPNNE